MDNLKKIKGVDTDKMWMKVILFWPVWVLAVGLVGYLIYLSI